jgi:hypothetical protein
VAGELFSQERIEKRLRPFVDYREEVRAQDGNDRLLFQALKHPFPEALRHENSAPPSKSRSFM